MSKKTQRELKGGLSTPENCKRFSTVRFLLFSKNICIACIAHLLHVNGSKRNEIGEKKSWICSTFFLIRQRKVLNRFSLNQLKSLK